jgi:bacterial/archaeal transporter family protein
MVGWHFWTFATILTWGIWAVLTKKLSLEIASPAHCQAVSTLGIVPVLFMLWTLPESGPVSRRRTGIFLALGSGLVSCLGNIAYFEVYNRGAKAAAVVPITALYPLVTILLAVPLLRERLSALQLVGIGFSMGAIYSFNMPGEEGILSAWLLVALISVVLWGVCGLLQKMSTNHISARSSASWFLIAFLPVAVLIVMRDPLPGSATASTWLLATAVGFTLALGNYTVLLAFASGGKASIITPLAALYPIVSIPIAILMLEEPINTREVLGILCALMAVGMLSYQPETPASAGEPT